MNQNLLTSETHVVLLYAAVSSNDTEISLADGLIQFYLHIVHDFMLFFPSCFINPKDLFFSPVSLKFRIVSYLPNAF